MVLWIVAGISLTALLIPGFNVKFTRYAFRFHLLVYRYRRLFQFKSEGKLFPRREVGKAFLVVQIVSQVYPLHWQLFKMLVVTSHDYKIFEKEVLF